MPMSVLEDQMCSLSIFFLPRDKMQLPMKQGNRFSVSSSFLNLNIKIIMILVGTKGLIWRGSV